MSETELDSFLGELILLGEEIRIHQLAISTLSSVRKTVICKLTENDVSQAEIADYLGVTPARINQIIHRE